MNVVDMQVAAVDRISDTEALEIKLDRLQEVLKNKTAQLQNQKVELCNLRQQLRDVESVQRTYKDSGKSQIEDLQ